MKKLIVRLFFVLVLVFGVVRAMPVMATDDYVALRLKTAQLTVGHYTNTDLTGDIIQHCANSNYKQEVSCLVDNDYGYAYWSKPYEFSALKDNGGTTVPVILIDVANGGDGITVGGFDMTLRTAFDCQILHFELQATTSADSDEWVTVLEKRLSVDDWTSRKMRFEFAAVTAYKFRLLVYDIAGPDISKDDFKDYTICRGNETRFTLAEIDLLEKEPTYSTTPSECPWRLEYMIKDGNATITKCEDTASGDIILPDTLGGYPLIRIGSSAFENCTGLTSITIPDSVTSIGNYAFYGCNKLNYVMYYGSTQDWNEISIGSNNAALTSASVYWLEYKIVNGGAQIWDCAEDVPGTLSIPKTLGSYPVTAIADRAFRFCEDISDIIIPSGVTKIGEDAFYGCRSLVSVTIPASVTEITKWAFYDCDNLTNVYYGGSREQWAHLNIGSHNSDLTSANIYYGSENSTATLSHTWDGGVVTKTPTCKATGVKTYTCAVCSSTKTESIAKVAHSYNSATCTKAKTCKTCGVTSGKKLGHTYTNSCDTKCNRCDAKRSITHSYKTTTTKATLSKNGSIVKKCTVCGREASKTTIRYVKSIKLSATSYVYNGKVKTPTVTVKDSAGKTLKEGTDYTVTYQSGRKNAGTYKVTIKLKGNYSGTKTLTFKILPAAKVATQPKTQRVEVGEQVKFTVKATGTGLKYQWQYSTNGKTWKNCSSTSATKATFSFTGKTSHDGNYYRCKVTDSAGNVVYTSKVRAYVLGIKDQPDSKTVTKGKTAKFTVEATGASKVYQWQYSTDCGKTWKNCSASSATKATFTFTSKTTHNGNYYRCRIKDSGGNTIYTSKVKLTVKK